MGPTASRSVRVDQEATKPAVTATVTRPSASIVCCCNVASKDSPKAAGASARADARARRGTTSATSGPTHASPNAANQTFSTAPIHPKSPMERGIRRALRVVLARAYGCCDALWMLTADRHHFAGHVRGVVAGEEDDDVCDLPRLGRAPECFARHQ